MTITMAAALACAPAAAQECAPPPVRADAVPADSGRAPDVLLRASVQAREVIFRTQPRARVTLNGCAPLDTVVTTERRNLPEPVEPGVTYRDVRVGVEIRAWFDVQCLPALAAAEPQLCAPVRVRTNVESQTPSAPAVPANPPRR